MKEAGREERNQELERISGEWLPKLRQSFTCEGLGIG